MDEEIGISGFKREDKVEAVFQISGREMGPERLRQHRRAGLTQGFTEWVQGEEGPGSRGCKRPRLITEFDHIQRTAKNDGEEVRVCSE